MSQTPSDRSLSEFLHCHAGIFEHLAPLHEMNTLLAAARRARECAADTVAAFQELIVHHHEEEEHELFPAVRKAATPGAERDQVIALIERLTDEHRQIETHWKALRRQLERIAAGTMEMLDLEAVHRLATLYQTHAHFEETHFLPLANLILGRHQPELEQLGHALHIRRAMQKTPAFT